MTHPQKTDAGFDEAAFDAAFQPIGRRDLEHEAIERGARWQHQQDAERIVDLEKLINGDVLSHESCAFKDLKSECEAKDVRIEQLAEAFEIVKNSMIVLSKALDEKDAEIQRLREALSSATDKLVGAMVCLSSEHFQMMKDEIEVFVKTVCKEALNQGGSNE